MHEREGIETITKTTYRFNGVDYETLMKAKRAALKHVTLNELENLTGPGQTILEAIFDRPKTTISILQDYINQLNGLNGENCEEPIKTRTMPKSTLPTDEEVYQACISNIPDEGVTTSIDKVMGPYSLREMVHALCRQGRKIEAIKTVRSATSYGLLESKNWVEDYIHRFPV